MTITTKCGRSKAKPSKCARPAPYDRLQAKASRYARTRGLFLLPEGTAKDPAWRLFSASTGRLLLLYRPGPRRWYAGRQSGSCKGWRDALRRAALAAGSAG